MVMEKVLQELLGHIFLGAHTVQMVPKYIWVWHCRSFMDIMNKIKDVEFEYNSNIWFSLSRENLQSQYMSFLNVQKINFTYILHTYLNSFKYIISGI